MAVSPLRGRPNGRGRSAIHISGGSRFIRRRVAISSVSFMERLGGHSSRYFRGLALPTSSVTSLKRTTKARTTAEHVVTSPRGIQATLEVSARAGRLARP